MDKEIGQFSVEFMLDARSQTTLSVILRDCMKSAFVKALIIVCVSSFTISVNIPTKCLPVGEQSRAPVGQELKLTTDPWFDAPPYSVHLSWATVSKHNRRYRIASPKDFRVTQPRPFQFGGLDKYFVIAIDRQARAGSRYKLLAMYSRDRERRHYQPYWITCKRDLSRTKLYNSDVGVVAVEFLEAGGNEVSILKWEEDRKTFTCVDVGSPSLVFP